MIKFKWLKSYIVTGKIPISHKIVKKTAKELLDEENWYSNYLLILINNFVIIFPIKNKFIFFKIDCIY